MTSTALEHFDARVTRSRLAWRPRTYVRLLRRALSRDHAGREIAAISDPRWRADIGVPLEADRKSLNVLAMALWPLGS